MKLIAFFSQLYRPVLFKVKVNLMFRLLAKVLKYAFTLAGYTFILLSNTSLYNYYF